jgi:beta-lactam-binding protein with PASTA domain
MGGVFISYRRQDGAGHARALYDRVNPRFPGQVFMDVAGSILPGVDFVDAIERAVGTCRVLIVIIGREWITGVDQKGRRRLDDPNDFIRLEVATALRRDVVVIPVLVEGAQMPTAGELPEDLARLARRQAIELRDTRWDADVDELVVGLRRTLEQATVAEATRDAGAIPPAVSRRPPEKHLAAARVGKKPEFEVQRVRLKGPLLAVIGTIALVAVSAGYFLGRANVVMPLLVGLSFDSAQERLRSAGLVLGETTPRRTAHAQPLQVLEQWPRSGAKVKKGSAVELVLAERQPRVVPNVVGKDLDAARAELSRAGISVRSVRSAETELVKPNSVTRVEPAAGTEMTGESPAVELVVAVGRDRRVTVPDLTGLGLRDAMERLKHLGLVAHGRAGKQDSRLKELQVIGQEPAAGIPLERGARVTLVFNPKAVVTTRDLTIFFPPGDERARTQAKGLGEYFGKLGWSVSVKAHDLPGGRVDYLVEQDARLAVDLAKRAEAWFAQQKLPVVRLDVRFVTPTPGTLGAQGGYLILWMPASAVSPPTPR